MSQTKSQIKSKSRVSNHGEVFTAEREVKAMCDLVANECIRLDSRFLEPACGDGNFLAEILTRKLSSIKASYRKEAYYWEKDSLLALGSLYGVELLQDNVLECRKRLYKIWEKFYKKSVKKQERSLETCESAKYILAKNIICGNALSLHKVDENGQDTPTPIIFSQWSFTKESLLKREDYTFESLLTKTSSNNTESNLFKNSNKVSNDGEGTLIKVYPPIHYKRIIEYE